MDSGGFVTDFSRGGDAAVMDSLTGVGTTDVDTECGALTTASTFVEGDAGLVDCLEGGSLVDASADVSGAGDVVTVTVSILPVVVTLAGGVEGGASQNTEAAGVAVPETVFTGVSVTSSTAAAAAETNSGETFGAVTVAFVSTGEDRGASTAGEPVDAAEASAMVGHGVESVCGELAAEWTAARLDCIEAAGRLVAAAFWVTVGAQVRVAEEETHACSNEVVSALTSAAQDIGVSAEGQNEVAETGEFAAEATLSPLSTGEEVPADGC